MLKGVGRPEYYLGGDVKRMDEHWTKEGIDQGFSAKTYISNVVPKFEILFGQEFKSIKTPMDENYHPELDEGDELSGDEGAQYRSLIGSLNWVVTLGRFDIHYATATMARYNMCPRAGHFKAAKRIMAYLKEFPHGRMLFDTNLMERVEATPMKHDWKAMYPDAEEDIPYDMLDPLGKSVRLTVYVDADHAHDLVTRRSVTGVLVFINNTPFRWVCKRQKTVETSTYGSELVAARVATELIMEIRYQLRMLGVPIDGPAVMLGDNMSVVLNTTVPSSALKKKHNAIAYHQVREAIAADIIDFRHVSSEDNKSDILTKPLSHKKYHCLVTPLLFRKANNVTMGRKGGLKKGSKN